MAIQLSCLSLHGLLDNAVLCILTFKDIQKLSERYHLLRFVGHTKLPLFDAIFAEYIFLSMSFQKINEELTDPRLIEARHTCDYGR